MAKPEVPDLVLSVDLGGSLTKVGAATNDGRYCLLALASEVGEIPKNLLEDVQAGVWGQPSPESSIWIGLKDGASYAVGSFARKNFRSQINLSLSKTELAVPKILGTIWVLQQKLNLNRSLYVRLGVLLPAGECSAIDQQELVDLLEPALRGFSTPTGKMTVRLFGKPVIKPEGGGVFLDYKNSSASMFSQRQIGILGIGYRNSNLLIAENGTIAEGDRITHDLGFHSLIGRCKELVGSTVDEVELATIVAQAGSDVNSRIIARYLEKLGKLRRLQAFVDAVKKSQELYWNQLVNWFKLIGANRLDAVVLYGGTTEYFKKSLIEYFGEGRLIWHSNVKIPTALLEEVSAEPGQTGLEFRFIDCWCYLQFMLERQSGYRKYGEELVVGEKVACG